MRATCSPGGVGHGWVKARYIDAGPVGRLEDAAGRLFIPARLQDNPALLDHDPDYVARLGQSGSPALVRAWLEGDWNASPDVFFDVWSARNIVAPFEIPLGWTRIRALDWGHATPFSVGWWAVVGEDTAHDGRVLPRGALVRYREWYGRSPASGGRGRRAPPGQRLTPRVVAAGILARERANGEAERIDVSVADRSIFSTDAGGPTIADRLAAAGVRFTRADNTRVGRFGGRDGVLTGWGQMRARILGRDGVPILYVFDTCADFIRTVPVLRCDPMRLEDVDTHAEDHIADETRYACLTQPLPLRA